MITALKDSLWLINFLSTATSMIILIHLQMKHPRGRDLCDLYFFNIFIFRTSIQPTIAELQEKIGQSVNNLITFFNRTQSSHTSISPSNSILVRLLTKGLVAALFDVFSHGLKRNKSRFM